MVIQDKGGVARLRAGGKSLFTKSMLDNHFSPGHSIIIATIITALYFLSGCCIPSSMQLLIPLVRILCSLFSANEEDRNTECCLCKR